VSARSQLSDARGTGAEPEERRVELAQQRVAVAVQQERDEQPPQQVRRRLAQALDELGALAGRLAEQRRTAHRGGPRPVPLAEGGVERLPELAFQGVFRAGTDPKTPELLVDDFERPNGLCFSLDERRLFINDTARKHIRVFDVTPKGTLTNGRVWAETKGDKPGAPDGMKLDSAANVYCCGPGGIHVFDRDANLLEVLETPEYTANFAWGDDDYRSLFVTASTSLYRIRRTIPGFPVF